MQRHQQQPGEAEMRGITISFAPAGPANENKQLAEQEKCRIKRESGSEGQQALGIHIMGMGDDGIDAAFRGMIGSVGF